jgi:predicted RNA-binding Zn-ribbon protein involved in translation (DUF1610 family)
VMKTLGMPRPDRYVACFGNDHYFLWYPDHLKKKQSQPSVCPTCGAPPKNGNVFYYMPIAELLQSFMESPHMVFLFSAAWRARNEWYDIGAEEWDATKTTRKRSELWHGDRWHSQRWFFDSGSTNDVGDYCKKCFHVIALAAIREYIVSSHHDGGRDVDDMNNGEEFVVSMRCPKCGEATDVRVNHSVTGSPVNQMILGHWDGWKPFTTSNSHACGSIEVMMGCMDKATRAKDRYVFPVVFVPLFKTMPFVDRYDAFLVPMRDELVKLYIDGFTIRLTPQIRSEFFGGDEEGTTNNNADATDDDGGDAIISDNSSNVSGDSSSSGGDDSKHDNNDDDGNNDAAVVVVRAQLLVFLGDMLAQAEVTKVGLLLHNTCFLSFLFVVFLFYFFSDVR